MVNTAKFLKGYHNRTYFYSSGTILARVTRSLKRYVLKLNCSVDGETDEENSGSDCSESQKPPPMATDIMIRKVCIHSYLCIYTRMCT